MIRRGVRGLAEVSLSGGRREVQGAENETPVALYARQLREIEFFVLEVAGIALGPRTPTSFAAVRRSSVVRALECLGVAARRAADRRAAVRATVEQGAQRARAVSQQDHRPQAQPGGDEIVVLRHLALVPEVDPDGAAHLGHFLVKHRRVGVEDPVRAVGLHQRVPVVGGNPRRNRNIHSVPMRWAHRRRNSAGPRCHCPAGTSRSARLRCASVSRNSR